MALTDLLIGALTFPDCTTDRALRSGVALAKRIGGELTVLSVKINLPPLGRKVANAVTHLDEQLLERQAESAATAQLQGAVARTAAEEAGVTVRTCVATSDLYDEGSVLRAAARTRDLCLLPIGEPIAIGRNLVEPILLGSGRPILAYDADAEVSATPGFERIAIAWDDSPHAARAVAEAMPLLKQAALVLVLVVTGDKRTTRAGAARDLLRHLRVHGVRAVSDELPKGDRPVAGVLRDYLAERRVELLVMGGFGHSRLRELVLGGVTADILAKPPCPVLLAH